MFIFKQAAALALRKLGVVVYALGNAEDERMDWGALAGAHFKNNRKLFMKQKSYWLSYHAYVQANFKLTTH